MLSSLERNEVLRLIDELRQAWEQYVSAVARDDKQKFHLGAKVVQKQEDLETYIKEHAS